MAVPNSLATLWVGPRLGPIELASARSFLRVGNPLVVYSYEPLPNLPEGVEGRDANEVLPATRIAIYAREQSPSLHSNFFRYALLRRTDHVWVDLDIIALQRFAFDSDRIYAFETAERVNCAVLRLPKEAPELAELAAFTAQTRGVAPHITGLRRMKYWVRTLGRGVPIEKWPWGSTGPRALTAALNRHGGLDAAMPVETFYPIHPTDCRRFLTPGALSEASFSAATFGVHLSASNIHRAVAREFGGVIPEASFLGQQIRRGEAEAGG